MEILLDLPLLYVVIESEALPVIQDEFRRSQKGPSEEDVSISTKRKKNGSWVFSESSKFDFGYSCECDILKKSLKKLWSKTAIVASEEINFVNCSYQINYVRTVM
jgi:hypothetical protein